MVTFVIFVTLEIFIMRTYFLSKHFIGIPGETKNFPFICLVDKTHHDGLAPWVYLVCFDYVDLVKEINIYLLILLM